MKSMLKMGCMVMALMVMAACQTMKVDTFNKRLAVGYASVTEVRKTTTTLLTNKIITAPDAMNIQKASDDVREGLDIARDLYKSVPKDGASKLEQALAALKTLEKYVGSK